MKVVFMGTPDFAVPCLEALVRSGHEVIAAVTQPDKPKGRGGQMAYPPVKETALAHGIPVYQPRRVREEEFQNTLRELAPDVAVVVAFGQILPQSVLDTPKYGCINVHASLLPKYRGAAPIQWAVIDGEKKSGVTTMQMDAGLDTGDMLVVKELELDPKETGGSLFDKLSALGAEALLETLEQIEAGTLQPVKQGETTTAYAAMLDKKMGQIDFTWSAERIERLIRGLNPWPSAYTYLNGKTLKVWDADVLTETVEGSQQEIVPGSILEVRKDTFLIACGEGVLAIRELQLEGKKRMNAEDFLRGYQLTEGTMLG